MVIKDKGGYGKECRERRMEEDRQVWEENETDRERERETERERERDRERERESQWLTLTDARKLTPARPLYARLSVSEIERQIHKNLLTLVESLLLKVKMSELMTI